MCLIVCVSVKFIDKGAKEKFGKNEASVSKQIRTIGLWPSKQGLMVLGSVSSYKSYNLIIHPLRYVCKNS